MDKQTIIADEARYMMQTYRRADVVLERGEGVYLFDSDGRRYLDFMSGIAVAALGHADQQPHAAHLDHARAVQFAQPLPQPLAALGHGGQERRVADTVEHHLGRATDDRPAGKGAAVLAIADGRGYLLG